MWSLSACPSGLFWAALALTLVGALCNTCNPGVLSPGWIYPLNDVSVEVGNPVDMICVLNTSHPNGVDGSWRNLSFYIDNQLVEAPLVRRHNETAIELHIERAQLSPNAHPNDHYVVSCRQNKETGICFRHVYVGYPPQPVSDFQCTSYNWERLECTWKEPYNPVQTVYVLSYQLVLRASGSSPCPEYNNPHTTRRVDGSDQLNGCVYSLDSRPLYRNSQRVYNFVVLGSHNASLQRSEQFFDAFDTYAHMIPGEMKKLKVSAITSSAALVEWEIPFNLQLFPPGLGFRAAYRILSSWADSTEYYEVPEASQVAWNSSTIKYRLNVALPYAYADYEVSIQARSLVANKSDERMWSLPATIGLRTDSARPCSSPNTTIGAFEVIGNRMEERTVTVRWSRLPLQCENGPGASYSIVLHDASGNPIAEKNVTSNTTHVQFGGLAREKAYEFKILAFNEAWYSSNYSQVFLPIASKMPTPPENVMRISYNATFFEIQWTRSVPSQSVSMSSFSAARADDSFNYSPNITDYTVFWCQSERDSPVECKGPLYWEKVPANQLALNVTVRTAENYQFAVAANQASVSSGLVWSTCIVSANGNGSQIKQIEVVSATSSSLDLSWSLPCSVQNGIVTGFKIYYCPVHDDYYENEVPECTADPEEREAGPNENRYRLVGLDAYTVYKIVMSVMTRLGEGQSSAPVLNRTAEGRPSAPLDLRTVDLTNQTVTLAWRRPELLNGPAPYYVILGAERPLEVPPSLQLEYTIPDLQSYTDYTIRLRACNSPDLCSVDSVPLPVKTKIGVPSEPILTTVKSNADNSSLIEIKWQHPIKPAGPISMTSIKIVSNKEDIYNAEGNTTEWLVDAASMCQPGQSLKIRLQAMNKDEDVELYGPWSSEAEYPCLREGLSAAQIAGISFGAAVLVLLVVGVVFAGRRVQVLRTKAERTEVVLPWEESGNGAGAEMVSPGGLKQVLTHQKDVNSIGRSFVANKANNFYGRLGGAPAVIALKKQQSGQDTAQPADGECTADRESRSSGHSSAPDSLSWHRASRSELSNSDSGAEFEAPNSPSPDTFVNPPLDAFAKPIARSSQNLPEVDVGFSQCTAVQMRDAHGSSAPDLARSAVAPYVTVGTIAPAGPSQSAGYVTLGQQPAESAASSPNASPNLSVGSNDSLIGKSERDNRPTVKILPLKRNSAGRSGGYVDASCIVEPVCELRASASPGYVSFKSQEAAEVDRTASHVPVSAPSSNGYVTLGATSAGAAPGATSTHYVKMGPQSNHSLSYV